MHFVDRTKITNPPSAELKQFNDKHKAQWVIYNDARSKKKKPLPAKPPAGWLINGIRNPLRRLFLKNCGYCGTHTDLGNDAEVDHHFPTSLDLKAEHVYNWENYIWSCPSCNGMKKHNYPFLNPCLYSDVKHIYFHSADGRYLYYKNTPTDVINKYEITEKYSNLNLKNNPDAREYIFRDATENHLSRLKIYWEAYQVEAAKQGEDSIEAREKMDNFNKRKKNFMSLLKAGNYLKFINYAFDLFCKKHNLNFPFSFDSLIDESGYLNE